MSVPSLLAPKYTPIGLDLGSDSVRAVQLRRGQGQYDLQAALEVRPDGMTAWEDQNETTAAADVAEAPPADASALEIGPSGANLGSLPMSPNDAQDSHSDEAVTFSDEECLLIAQLQRLVGYEDFHGREVVIHCPLERLDLRPVALPSPPNGLKRDAIMGALALQAADNLSLPQDKVVYDYQGGEYNEHQHKLIVTAVSAEAAWIARRVQLVNAAGFRCLAVQPLPCALATLAEDDALTDAADLTDIVETPADSEDDATEPQAPPEYLRVVLDMGRQSSRLVVGRREGPVFARHFEFGGAMMIDDIMHQLNVAPEHARTLLHHYGLEPPRLTSDFTDAEGATAVKTHSTETAQAISKALRQHLRELIEGLTRSLNYVINEHRDAGLREILLTGAAAYTNNLAQFLTDEFELPVRHLQHQLLDDIACDTPPSRRCPGRWTTALALALPKEVR